MRLAFLANLIVEASYSHASTETIDSVSRKISAALRPTSGRSALANHTQPEDRG
jgi:hypothetical protein